MLEAAPGGKRRPEQPPAAGTCEFHTKEQFMTELLAQQDAYLKEFRARVVALHPDEQAVALDRTAFFPGGGGQPADHGRVAGIPVVRLERRDDLIWHYLETAGPGEGEEVLGELDWERRYALMRTHTAFHILCGVVFRDYGAQVTGGNMDLLKGRMDFEFETLRHELVEEIEARVNAEIRAARQVRVRTLPREEAFRIPDLIRTKINLLPETIREVRIVEIVGLDLQADGGTHLNNTREVGQVKVSDYKSKGRINKRIFLSIGD
jgi:misacylated tRNA(Ala) deacylase